MIYYFIYKYTSFLPLVSMQVNPTMVSENVPESCLTRSTFKSSAFLSSGRGHRLFSHARSAKMRWKIIVKRHTHTLSLGKRLWFKNFSSSAFSYEYPAVKTGLRSPAVFELGPPFETIKRAIFAPPWNERKERKKTKRDDVAHLYLFFNTFHCFYCFLGMGFINFFLLCRIG